MTMPDDVWWWWRCFFQAWTILDWFAIIWPSCESDARWSWLGLDKGKNIPRKFITTVLKQSPFLIRSLRVGLWEGSAKKQDMRHHEILRSKQVLQVSTSQRRTIQLRICGVLQCSSPQIRMQIPHSGKNGMHMMQQMQSPLLLRQVVPRQLVLLLHGSPSSSYHGWMCCCHKMMRLQTDHGFFILLTVLCQGLGIVKAWLWLIFDQSQPCLAVS